MGENPREWPRCHTCLHNWCPKPGDHCKTCNAVIDLILNQQPLSAEAQKVLDENRWDLYAR